MRKLIDDVGTYARSIGDPFERAPVALNPLMEEILFDLRGDIAQSGAIIAGDLGKRDAIAAPVPEPARQCDQVSQSGKSAGNSGGRCHSGERQNSRDRPRQGHRHRAEISPVDLRHVQASAHAGCLSGSGLGLALCARVVANHEGSIEVRSAPGEGSAFEVILHRAGSQPAGAPGPA
jgi:hypothetical protein